MYGLILGYLESHGLKIDGFKGSKQQERPYRLMVYPSPPSTDRHLPLIYLVTLD